MSVNRAQVEHIAKLAALALDEATLPELTRQIGQILEYVSQLEAVEETPGAHQLQGYPGPRAPLRDDEPRRSPLAVPLEQIAPAFADGLFLVPRLGSVGDSAGPGADIE